MATTDICLCTFRRPSIAATLRSLAAQRGAEAIASVIVADNDEEPSARGTIERLRAELPFRVNYVHAPARNISRARNACLDAASAERLAFIDDDEEAPPGWLDALAAAMDASGAAVVLGPVDAIYPDDAPAWLCTGDFHSTRPAIRRGGEIDTGYSCNALLRRDAIGGLRFDEALGRTGGEDDLFFSQLWQAGHRIVFAPDAVVHEVVTPDRMTLRWLRRRAFRNGQTFARIRIAREGRARVVARSGAKLIGYALIGVAGLWSPVRRRRAIVRASLHAGALAFAGGKKELKLYGG